MLCTNRGPSRRSLTPPCQTSMWQISAARRNLVQHDKTNTPTTPLLALFRECPRLGAEWRIDLVSCTAFSLQLATFPVFFCFLFFLLSDEDGENRGGGFRIWGACVCWPSKIRGSVFIKPTLTTLSEWVLRYASLNNAQKEREIWEYSYIYVLCVSPFCLSSVSEKPQL